MDKKPPYAILRLEKIHNPKELDRVEAHNTRKIPAGTVEGAPAPIDWMSMTGTFRQRAEQVLQKTGATWEKGKVLAAEVLLSASPEWWANASFECKKEWIKIQYEFAVAKFGPGLISFIPHLDESTPHVQLVGLPLYEAVVKTRGRKPSKPESIARRAEEEAKAPKVWRLSYDEKFGGHSDSLADLQTEYHGYVKHLGLARGEDTRGKGRRHKPLKQIKRELQEKEKRLIEERKLLDEAWAELAERGEVLDQHDEEIRKRREEVLQIEHQNQLRELEHRAKATELRNRERELEAREAEAGERELAFAKQVRCEAERLKEETERARNWIEQERRLLEEARRQMDAEIELQQAELNTLTQIASEKMRKATADAEAARRNREASEAALDAARTRLSETNGDRCKLEEEKRLHYAQLALLARAADDRNGLQLREGTGGVVMNRANMTEDEKAVHASLWPSAIVTMARALAKALERVRQALADLASKEKKLDDEREKVEERKRQLAAEREQHDAAVERHTAAFADLQRRLDACAAAERRLEETIDKVAEGLASAQAKEAEAKAAQQAQTDWLEAVRLIDPTRGNARISADGKVMISPALHETLPGSVIATLQKSAPDWVKGAIGQGEKVARLREQAARALAEGERKEQASAAERQRLERSRRLLDDVVAGRCVPAARDGVLSLSYQNSGQSSQVLQVNLAELEPSTVHLLKHHMQIATMAKQVSSLHAELKDEREKLAREHPERALELQRDQDRTAQKVARVISPPPGWEQSHGR